MNKLLIANWKMNPRTLEEAEVLSSAIISNKNIGENVCIIIAPAFPHLQKLKQVMLTFPGNKVKLGAQNIFWEQAGAFTGEVSVSILKNLGVEYIIVGHSERRRLLGETNLMINKKNMIALKYDLKVILCVGEPEVVRSKGLDSAKKFVKSQLESTLKGMSSDSLEKPEALTVAYEPVWAIGTGIPDKPSDSAAMSVFIKDTLRFITGHSNHMVLYGGSVNAANAQSFLEYVEIDGALVGGASLKADEFNKIVEIAHDICELANQQGK